MSIVRRSIQYFRDLVAQERSFALDEQHVERILGEHFQQFVDEEVAEKAELRKAEDLRWTYIVNLGPGFYSGNQADYQLRLQVVITPAPHRKDKPVDCVIFARDTEARIRFFEQFGWKRLGFIHAGTLLKECYEVGKELDGFWVIYSISA